MFLGFENAISLTSKGQYELIDKNSSYALSNKEIQTIVEIIKNITEEFNNNIDKSEGSDIDGK